MKTFIRTKDYNVSPCDAVKKFLSNCIKNVCNKLSEWWNQEIACEGKLLRIEGKTI